MGYCTMKNFLEEKFFMVSDLITIEPVVNIQNLIDDAIAYFI